LIRRRFQILKKRQTQPVKILIGLPSCASVTDEKKALKCGFLKPTIASLKVIRRQGESQSKSNHRHAGSPPLHWRLGLRIQIAQAIHQDRPSRSAAPRVVLVRHQGGSNSKLLAPPDLWRVPRIGRRKVGDAKEAAQQDYSNLRGVPKPSSGVHKPSMNMAPLGNRFAQTVSESPQQILWRRLILRRHGRPLFGLVLGNRFVASAVLYRFRHPRILDLIWKGDTPAALPRNSGKVIVPTGSATPKFTRRGEARGPPL
jgi:hypothetical protein